MASDWQDFFSTIAQVAVTAFSVMFLAIQVRSAVWRGRRLLSVAAVAALVELFVPLLVALVTTMPGVPWRLAAVLASVVGLSMVTVHVVLYCIDRNKPDTAQFDHTQAWGALLSFMVYALIAVAAILPTAGGLYLLAGVCVWLLFSGSFEAWWLLEPKGMRRPNEKLRKRESPLMNSCATGHGG